METAKFQIEVPAAWLNELNERRAFYEPLLRKVLAEKINVPATAEAIEARLELVNIICRAKADVRNWRDLEREIIESSI
jgi:hypothetical protein